MLSTIGAIIGAWSLSGPYKHQSMFCLIWLTIGQLAGAARESSLLVLFMFSDIILSLHSSVNRGHTDIIIIGQKMIIISMYISLIISIKSFAISLIWAICVSAIARLLIYILAKDNIHVYIWLNTLVSLSIRFFALECIIAQRRYLSHLIELF